MRKKKGILLMIAAISLLAASASAQMYHLYSDESMTTNHYFGEAYIGFPVLLILEPGPDGAFGAEYYMEFPHNIIQNPAPVPFPGIAVSMGDPIGGAGISLGFEVCQTETFVLYTFNAFPLDTTPGLIRVLPHPDTGIVAVATCEEPLRPTIEAWVYNYFYYNQCWQGTEESSWGAVKAQYRD